jgi:hypothetical protein
MEDRNCGEGSSSNEKSEGPGPTPSERIASCRKIVTESKTAKIVFFAAIAALATQLKHNLPKPSPAPDFGL